MRSGNVSASPPGMRSRNSQLAGVAAAASLGLFRLVVSRLASTVPDRYGNTGTVAKTAAGLLSLGILIQISSLFTANELQLGSKGAYPLEVVEEVGSIALIGRLLFTDYILSFEIISILLLVAVIGAVVIAKRRFQ